MRTLLALAVLASSAHAALIVEIQHPVALDTVPTFKSFVFDAAAGVGTSAAFGATYSDADLGVTIFTADAQLVSLFNRAFTEPPAHGVRTWSVSVGDWSHQEGSSGERDQLQGSTPMDYDGNVVDAFGKTVAEAIPGPGYANRPVEYIAMTLSPFVQVGGKWTAMQTVSLFDSVPVPEPSTLAIAVALLAISARSRLCK
jgi:hypothetical protein